MPLRIELSSSATDADEMAAVLAAAGFHVLRVPLQALGTRGDACIVDLEQAGASEALSTMASQDRYPVVRIGGSADQAGLARPVRHDALLVALRRALNEARQSDLDGVMDTAEVHLPDEAPFEHTSGESDFAHVLHDTPAQPSVWLGSLLREACGLEALEAFTAGQRDDASALAPDALFEAQAPMGDTPDEDHDLTPLELALPQLEIDAQVLPAPTPAPSVPAPPNDPRRGWLRLDDAALGRLDATAGTRTGRIPSLGMLRLLWRVTELGLDVELDAQTEVSRVVLRFLAGGLRELWGESCQRTLKELGQGSASNEGEARAQLDAAVRSARLSRFVADRAVRVHEEAQLVELALAETASFVLRPLGSGDIERLAASPSPLSSPALALVTRGARARLGEETLKRLTAGAAILKSGSDLGRRLEQAEVEPELRQLLERHDGGPYAVLLEEAGPDVGAAGLLCLLAVLGSVRFVGRGSAPALAPA